MPTKADFIPFENIFATPLRNGLTRPKAVRGKGVKMINMGELFAHSRIDNINTDRVPFGDGEISFLLKSGDLLFARQSLVLSGAGKCSIFVGDNEEVTYEGHIIRARIDSKIADPLFYYYFFNSPVGRQTIESIVEQVAAAGIRGSDLAKLKIPFPPLPEQRAIAEILGALDDKIEVNRRMNVTLESMARAVFRQWFVENEEVESWKVGKLGDVITNFDSKRVPVANRERAQRQGKYPYYGAASVMDYVDDYLFDGIYVLMGEDGSVVDDEGHPIIQYVWGKIWVNNHAHVLQGINGICNEHLYILLKDVNILPYITGAVQPKINQANMNSIPIPLPPMELRKKFEEFVSPLFAKIRANDEESRTLGSLRDSLLPKLMRGEVRVKDVED